MTATLTRSEIRAAEAVHDHETHSGLTYTVHVHAYGDREDVVVTFTVTDLTDGEGPAARTVFTRTVHVSEVDLRGIARATVEAVDRLDLVDVDCHYRYGAELHAAALIASAVTGVVA